MTEQDDERLTDVESNATAELPDTPSAAEARLVAFMRTRGYSIEPGTLADASQISFHRGSLWGSLTSFSPLKRGARVTVRGLGTGTFLWRST